MSNLDLLNNEQRKAVLCTEGPVLILAGAGSGKTRVITNRIAYLIEEKGVDPWNIMAVTFTNKAAGEMRDRVRAAVGENSYGIWVATFHSTCVRILRKHIEVLGYKDSYAIYDTDDQKSLMKQVLKKLDIDSKTFKEKMFLGKISRAKDEMITPEDMAEMAGSDFTEKLVARVYAEYQKELKENNALDFDDLLLKTVELFESRPDILEMYQDRFRYIMIDEYQDTNTVQFRLVQLLAGKYRNLCVVGDDDQSIYRFRGANIRNILDFEKEYPDALVVRLEQNYRSTDMILGAANEVIKHNKGRKEKRLWTENGVGDPVKIRLLGSAYEEAEFVVGDISRRIRQGISSYKDNAILYRTNAQSRLFEEKLINANIPYKLVGGVNFYARREIKDLLAYLRLLVNTADSLSVVRIINTPKRGIGATSISRIRAYADEMGMSFYEAISDADSIPGISRGLGKIKEFAELITELEKASRIMSVSELLGDIISKTGYVRELEIENTEESAARIENINEFMSKVVSYEQEHGEESSLSGFLEEVSLIADIDSLNESDDYVVLMTLHSAKGLEFPNVYLTGLEDGLFPGYGSINSDDPTDLEEERRLCYVGITRAMNYLTITCAKNRMINGETQYNPISRFLKDIPDEYADVDLGKTVITEMPKNNAYKDAGNAFRSKPFYMTERSGSRSSYGDRANGNRTYGSSGAAGSSAGLSSLQKGSDITSGGGIDYSEGDRVRHMKFGEGTVLSIKNGGRDYEVTVEFDKAGVKKMFAAFAKLRKV